MFLVNVLTFSTDRISRCCFAEDGKQRNVPTCKTHVQSVQSCCVCSLNRLFCDVLVAVAVVLASAPYKAFPLEEK